MRRTQASTPGYHHTPAQREARFKQKKDETGADYGAMRVPPLPGAFTQKQVIADTRTPSQKGR